MGSETKVRNLRPVVGGENEIGALESAVLALLQMSSRQLMALFLGLLCWKLSKTINNLAHSRYRKTTETKLRQNFGGRRASKNVMLDVIVTVMALE